MCLCLLMWMCLCMAGLTVCTYPWNTPDGVLALATVCKGLRVLGLSNCPSLRSHHICEIINRCSSLTRVVAVDNPAVCDANDPQWAVLNDMVCARPRLSLTVSATSTSANSGGTSASGGSSNRDAP